MKFDRGILSQVSKISVRISAVTWPSQSFTTKKPWVCQPRKPQHVHVGPDKSCKLRIKQGFDYQCTYIVIHEHCVLYYIGTNCGILSR